MRVTGSFGEGLARGDVGGRDAVEDLREGGRGGLGLGDLSGQRGQQVAFAFGRVADL